MTNSGSLSLQRVALLAAGVLFHWSACSSPVRADQLPTIDRVQLGFDGVFKVGRWCPVQVQLSGPSAEVRVEVGTAEADDTLAFYGKQVALAGPTTTITLYTRPGKLIDEATVRLLDLGGRVVSERVFPLTGRNAPVKHELLKLDQKLILTTGHVPHLAGLYSMPVKLPELLDQGRVVALSSVAELPEQWFGYDGVDAVVWATGSGMGRALMAELGSARLAAFSNWIAHGGDWVVSVGQAAEQLRQTPLATLIPFAIEGTIRLPQVASLEAYAHSQSSFRFAGSMSLGRISGQDADVLAREGPLPLVTRSRNGFGRVTVITVDFEQPPLTEWDGIIDLWQNLLQIDPHRQRSRQSQAWAGFEVTDLATELTEQAGTVTGVQPIRFGWVAFAVFVYLMVVSPLDYLLLRHAIKHFELTWLTFGAQVLLAVGIAWYVSGITKGNTLRVRQIDVIDVNSITGQMRGTTLAGLYSPVHARYQVTLDMPRVVLGTMSRPEPGFLGLYARGGTPLFRTSYSYGARAATLEQLPIKTCSQKLIMAQWLDHFAGDFEPKIRSRLRQLDGSFRNPWPHELTECAVAYRGVVHLVGNVPPRGRGRLRGEGIMVRRLGSWLERRVSEAVVNLEQKVIKSGRYRIHQPEPDEPVRLVTFYDHVPPAYLQPKTGDLASYYLAGLNLSDQLDRRHAVLLARTVADRGALKVAGATPQRQRTTFLRVVLPVALKEES